MTVTPQGRVAGPLEEASRDLPFLETREGESLARRGWPRQVWQTFQRTC